MVGIKGAGLVGTTLGTGVGILVGTITLNPFLGIGAGVLAGGIGGAATYGSRVGESEEPAEVEPATTQTPFAGVGYVDERDNAEASERFRAVFKGAVRDYSMMNDTEWADNRDRYSRMVPGPDQEALRFLMDREDDFNNLELRKSISPDSAYRKWHSTRG